MIEDYLEYYYNLHSIVDVINYINNNTHLNNITISRLFYFVMLKYISSLKNNISIWINLVSVCLKRIYNIKINDKMNISAALLKIQSIYNDDKTNTINYLLSIKNILNDSI